MSAASWAVHARNVDATRAQHLVPVTALPKPRTISCVIPCFNEAGHLNELLEQLELVLDGTLLQWEVIVVDDGSSDTTLAVAKAWADSPGFRCVSLSRNFGKEAALMAGLKAARGDAVILLDGDLQHSPDIVDNMIFEWTRGAEVVYAVRQDRAEESAAKRLGTHAFYRMVNAFSRFRLAENASDFRLMDRKVVQALLALPERTRFMKGLYAWVGFRAVALPYTPVQRASGKSSFSAFRLVSLALDGLTAFTTWPLRMVSVVGALLAVPTFVYGFYLVAAHLLVGNAVSGWTTIVVSLMFFMGIQMIFIGLLGEYIARIFDEVKARPLYVVSQEYGEGIAEGSA